MMKRSWLTVYENTHLQFILMIKRDSWDEVSISFEMHKVAFNEQTYGVRWLNAAFCKKWQPFPNYREADKRLSVPHCAKKKGRHDRNDWSKYVHPMFTRAPLRNIGYIGRNIPQHCCRSHTHLIILHFIYTLFNMEPLWIEDSPFETHPNKITSLIECQKS